MVLRTRGLTKQFGGLTAVADVDLEVGSDELCSLIGPNGAGKTTFFNLLTGVLEPTAGSIELGPEGDRTDITDAAPHETAQLGIHRSYQVTNVFPTNTVFENVRIASQAAGGDATNFWRNAETFDEYHEEAHRILDRVGLTADADRPASALSHGAKRQLEVGIALAGDPDVLLLDEPNAGVSSESVGDIIDLIEDVATDHAVLLVEHNMDIVMNVSDRVVVLNRGAVIADGKPADVRDDETVQEAYLGGYDPSGAGSTTPTDGNDTGDAGNTDGTEDTGDADDTNDTDDTPQEGTA